MLNETMYRMALQYLPHYGNVLIKKLIQETGTAAQAFDISPKVMAKFRKYNRFLPKPVLTPEIEKRVEKEYAWMQKHDVSLCFFADNDYPKRLRNCPDAPYMFYYGGNNQFNTPRSIAIVGTRNASSYGKDVVKKLISECAPYNVSVISGLAEGIDTVAHEQALAFGMNTIAVLGSGLGHLYPSSNQKLAQNILKKEGTLISEYPYNTKPDKQNFPKRNRIIAGLSDTVVVAESAKKGGSIITAHIAQSYNRDVFAMPGSLFQPSYTGCHELIRNNIAAIVTSGDELAAMMGWNQETSKPIQRSLFVDLSDTEQGIVDLIKKHNEISIDEINLLTPQLTPSKIAGVLLGLELNGVVECKPGKVYRLA